MSPANVMRYALLPAAVDACTGYSAPLPAIAIISGLPLRLPSMPLALIGLTLEGDGFPALPG